METPKKITELTNSDRPWIKTITVVEKCVPYQSTTSPTKLQKFIFQDDEGAKVEGIMFNKAFHTMSSKLQLYHKYRISNAEIKQIDRKYIKGTINVQWIIDTTTVIENVENQAQMVPMQKNYVPFSKIPEFYEKAEGPIDIIAIVVAFHPTQTVITQKGPRMLQKFTLMNDSFEAIKLSLWAEFVTAEGAALVRMIRQYPVLIARRVNIAFFNGLELSTNFRTSLLIDASSDEALDLKNWTNQNQKRITDILASNMDALHVVTVPMNATTSITPVANIVPGQKVACSKVFLSLKGISQNYHYMACKKCFNATTAGFQFEYTCNMCSTKQLAEPRCRFEAKLTDASGTINATFFGDIAETLLGLTAMQAMQGVSQNYLQSRETDLKHKEYIVQLTIPKLKLHEIAPKYTVAKCSANEVFNVQEQTTPPKPFLAAPPTAATNASDDRPSDLSQTSAITEKLRIEQEIQPSPCSSLEATATETPPEPQLNTRGKAKACLLPKFDDLSPSTEPSLKKRK